MKVTFVVVIILILCAIIILTVYCWRRRKMNKEAWRSRSEMIAKAEGLGEEELEEEEKARRRLSSLSRLDKSVNFIEDEINMVQHVEDTKKRSRKATVVADQIVGKKLSQKTPEKSKIAGQQDRERDVGQQHVAEAFDL